MTLHRSLFMLVLLSPMAVLAAPCKPAIFPGYSWPSKTKEVSEAKKVEIAALEKYAFTLTGDDDARLGIRTDSVLIIKGGEILYERYARGWDELKPHISWSVAKSVTSALAGVAVQQGRLTLDESICDKLNAQREPVCKISVKNLLEFSSGIDWQEEYEDSVYQSSGPLAMFFGEGHRDMLGFILGHRSYAAPGSKWRYSTAETTVLAAVAKKALEPKFGKDWAWKALFDVLGMRGVSLEEDVLGTPLGGSHMFATSRDYARFGYLYLNDGCWNGTRLLPEDWVKRSTEPSAVYVASAGETQKTPNGWMWWLNRVAGPAKELPWKDVPPDAYSANGHWGQYVTVVPSLDLVIVRTGDDRKSGFKLADFLPLALAVAK